MDGSPTIQVFDGNGSLATTTPSPFGTQPVRTAMADINGDGTPDVIAVGGFGGPARLVVIDGATGKTLFDLPTFEGSFTGGANVAGGDFNGDGFADIAVGADFTGGPRVILFNGRDGSRAADFFAIDDPDFRGGVRVAFGDINGDGKADLIVAAGIGGGPRVALYDGATLDGNQTPQRLVPDFFVFEESLRNGATVTAGDITGDGKADLIFGGGPGGGPRVFILDGAELLGGRETIVADFFAGDTDDRDGVRPTVKDLDGDQFADLLTVSGDGGRVYLGRDIVVNGADPSFEPLEGVDGMDGVFVG
jgi:hypothetical protein